MADYTGVIGTSFTTTAAGVVDKTDLTEWLDELVVRCPGVGVEAATQGLRTAIREFCVVSGAWLRKFPKVQVIEGQSIYDLNALVNDSKVLFINSVFFVPSDESFVEVLPFRAQDDPYFRRVPNAYGKPYMFEAFPEKPGQLELHPIPSGLTGLEYLEVHVSLQLKSHYQTDLPQHLIDQHYDILLDGATSKLMMHQDRPYSNLVQAQYYATRFRAGCAVAREQVRKNYVRSDTNWAYPRWA